MLPAPRVRHDAIVIGGGPAGSVAALLLRRRGWSVALLERGVRGRDKCCGHCLSGRSLALLRAMELDGVVASARYGTVEGLEVRLPGARGLPVDLRAAGEECEVDSTGWLVDRRRMDAALLDAGQACGVEVHHGVGARLHRDEAGALRVRAHDADGRGSARELIAPLIIGADGLGSAVARAIGVGPEPRRLLASGSQARAREHPEVPWSVRTWGAFEGVMKGAVEGVIGRCYGFSADLDDIGEVRGSGESWTSARMAIECPAPGTVAMHVTRDGYLGVARGLEGRVHVAGLVRAPQRRGGKGTSAPHPRRDPVSFVERLAERHPSLQPIARALSGCTTLAIGPMPWRPTAVARRVGEDNAVALVGDAAGYVEPFTGEGMTWAFESAALLAASARAPGAFDPAAYQRAWRWTIGLTQRRCGLVTTFLRRPVLLGLAARILPRAPVGRPVMSSIPPAPFVPLGPVMSVLSGVASRIAQRTVLR